MPKQLRADIEAACAEAQAVAREARLRERNVRKGLNRVDIDAMPSLCGDRTDGGTRKAHKPTDRIGTHKPATGYVLSDLTVRDWNGTPVAIRRSTSRIIQRDEYGNVDATLTLAVASHVHHLRGTIKKGHHA